MRITIAMGLALALAGCVSDEQRAAQVTAQSACRRAGVTHLAAAKCENAILAANGTSSPYADLASLSRAKREEIAARIDRHEITEEQGNLEVAQLGVQMTNEMQRRSVQQVQAYRALQPTTVYVRPCGAVAGGIYVNTAC